MVTLVNSLTSAISLDSSVEVRRGAVLLIADILTSLGTDAPTVLSTLLLPLPEMLARLAETDIDPVVRVHASDALLALQSALEASFYTDKIEDNGLKHGSMAPPALKLSLDRSHRISLPTSAECRCTLTKRHKMSFGNETSQRQCRGARCFHACGKI